MGTWVPVRLVARAEGNSERPSDYREREEFYEVATASWNMERRSYRKAACYAMDTDGHIVLREETEVLHSQHTRKAGSGTSGLEIC